MHTNERTRLLRRSTVIGGLLTAALGLLAPPGAIANDGECQRRLRAAVAPLMEPDVAGRARLCIGRDGVSGRMEVEHLKRRNAYTVWFAYIDDPSQCATPFACSDADFGAVKPLGVFGRFDSVVAGADGEEEFEGRVRGMRLRRGSQVWLLVFGHGPADLADRSHLARQLLTPEDPAAGAPHLGNMIDGPLGIPAAIAVFTIP